MSTSFYVEVHFKNGKYGYTAVCNDNKVEKHIWSSKHKFYESIPDVNTLWQDVFGNEKLKYFRSFFLSDNNNILLLDEENNFLTPIPASRVCHIYLEGFEEYYLSKHTVNSG